MALTRKSPYIATNHRVSGLMLANHTSVASVSSNPLPFHSVFIRDQLFKRMLDQFDRLRKRNAFLEQYKKEKVFENGLEEFDDARCVAHGSGLSHDELSSRATCEELLKEYKACEREDYISYVSYGHHAPSWIDDLAGDTRRRGADIIVDHDPFTYLLVYLNSNLA